MALRAVSEHPKFADLKRALGLPKFQTLGLLEALWHFTGRFAPRGNIGKFTNAQIEAWIEWQGKPSEAIDALLNSGWLDKSPTHRLVVHDWHAHADATTKKHLGRTKEGFVSDMSGQIGKVSGPPEPVPVPGTEPEADTGRMPPEMLAKQVQVEARISGMEALATITDQCRFAQGEGQPDEQIADRMVKAWNDLDEANKARKLEHRWGAVKFFGEGHWRDPRGWPWKPGIAPARNPVTSIDPLEEIRAQKARAREQQAREEAQHAEPRANKPAA